jgi:DNA-directed RNA polymerase specialized sigma24 family protein
MTNRPSKDDLEILRELLKACLGGDVVSLKRFQDQFGEDIYNFPIKVRRIDKGKAADFYCYCFEKGRIYKRLLTFEGRCSLRTYQYHILIDLCNEWRREDKGQAFDLEPLANHKELADIDVLIDDIPWSEFNAFLKTLDPEDTIYIKLLSYHEFGLKLSDLRAISKISNKPVDHLMDMLIEIDWKLAQRNETYAERLNKLDEIDGRILDLERKIKHRIQGQEEFDSARDTELIEWQEKLQWRRRQQEQMLAGYKRVKCEVSYRDIAALLNLSLGKVSERINQIKKRISEHLHEPKLDKRREMS